MLTGTYWGCEWRPELPFVHFTVIFQTETNSKSCSFCDHSKVLDKYVRDLVTITWGNQDITDTTDFPRRITATGLEFISWAVWTGGRDQPSELKGQSSRFIQFVFPLILHHKTTESLYCFNNTMLDSTGHTKSAPAVCAWTQQCQVTVALQSCKKRGAEACHKDNIFGLHCRNGWCELKLSPLNYSNASLGEVSGNSVCRGLKKIIIKKK